MIKNAYSHLFWLLACAVSADILIPYVVPSGSNAMTPPTQFVSGAALRPKQPINIAHTHSLSAIPNLTQALLVGGRVIKQGGKAKLNMLFHNIPR